MKKLSTLIVLLTILCHQGLKAQCGNTGNLVAGSLTPPGVGLSTTLQYNSGQYVLAYVNAGASYNVSTCGGSAAGGPSFDTQLMVYDDATGTLLAYNDDYCGLQSNAGFTATRCGYVRVILMQYFCNGSGLVYPVTMTQNTAGNTPVTAVTSQTNVAGCAGDATGAAMIVASGGATPYTFTWSPVGGNDSLASNLAAGNYTYYVSDANNCGILPPGSSTVQITEPPLLTVSPAISSATVCSGSAVTFSANASGGTGAYTYTWSTGSNSSTATDNPTGTSSYTISVQDANNCAANGVTGVTAVALPVVTAGISPSAVICTGDNVTLSGGGASTYTWTGSATDGVAFVPTLTSYTVTGTDGNGCENMAVQSLTINALPTLAISGASAICNGSSATETASGASTYTWSTTETTASISINPTSTSAYTVTGTDGNNCVNSTTTSVTVNQLPIVGASVSPADVICAGDNVTLSGSGADTYTWTGGASDGVAFAPTLSSYTVTGTDVNGCMNTAVQSLTINALPALTITGAGSLCAGSAVTETASGADTYTWSTTETTASISVNPAGNTTYTVTGTDVNGCVNTAMATLTVNALPTVNASSSNTLICTGETATLSASGADTYTWSTTETTASISVSPVSDVTYTVTGTDVNGCDGMATVTQSVSACTGIEAYASDAAVLLAFPNPNNGAFTIRSNTGLQLQIINELGQPVLNITLDGANNYEASIDHLASGIYFMTGRGDHSVNRQKIVVTQ